MIKFRFHVISKTEFEKLGDQQMVQVSFSASQQESFGKYTPSVQFQASMVKSAADQFVLGGDYYFTAAPASD